MSREHAEFLDRWDEAVRRDDLDALVELHDPHCEISPLIARVEGGDAYRGHEGVRAFWSDFHAEFADWLPERERVRSFGDTMIVRVHFRGHGRDSGAAIDRYVWQALRLRAGRAVWWASYPSESEALEALGRGE